MRLYNGAPDSELKAHLGEIEALDRRMKISDPCAQCIYYPLEQGYWVWSGLKPVGGFDRNPKPLAEKKAAIQLAIDILENPK